jgi:integrase
MTAIAATPDPTPAVTVRELINRYLEEQELRRRGGLIGARLVERLHRACGSFAKRFGDRPAASIRPSDVTRWILETEGWIADATREHHARAIKAAFRWATDEDLIQRDPLRRVTPCWGVLEPRGAMTRGQYEGVMRAAGAGAGCAPKARSAFRRAMYFLWATGCRTKEMRTADWSQVDWEKCLIRQKAHKTRRKSGRDRLIPVGATPLRLLRFMHRRLGQPTNGLIFTTSRGKAWDAGSFAKLFRRFAKACGVPRGVSPYSARHSFAVEALEAGIGERQIADVLGHTTTKYVAWYGADVRAKPGYLNGIADQVLRRREGEKP